MNSPAESVLGGVNAKRSLTSRIWRNNSLALVLIALFIIATAAQVLFGLQAYNQDQIAQHRAPIALQSYLRSGHFWEALFENWESEFLQMGLFVLLSVRLKQKGSAESKPMEGDADVDDEPRNHNADPKAPWPVRRGGVALWIYRNSLTFAFFFLFAISILGHALGGHLKANEENLAHGQPSESLLEYVTSSQFWFESFQNWQSEFLAVLAIVVLTIFLRQYGSPQSKPVAAPHSDTGR